MAMLKVHNVDGGGWCVTKNGRKKQKEEERKREREYLSRWCKNGSAMVEPASGTHTLFQCWQ